MLFSTTFAESEIIDIVHSDGSATRVTATDYGWKTDVSTKYISKKDREAQVDLPTSAGACVIVGAGMMMTGNVVVGGLLLAAGVSYFIFD